MTARHVDHLLVGGGIASATCAATLREEGAEGSILVVGREPDAPYHRPPVTKGYLGGAEDRPSTLIHPEAWWDEQRVELLTRTSVMALDTEAKVATLADKSEVSYLTALVATGAMVRRLNVDGAQLEGIHYLRALANADTLRADAAEHGPVVCVGGSYIGCEAASTLTTLGSSCTVLMQESEPLERHFGATAGRYFRSVLESHGVEVRGGVEVEAFTGDGDRVQGVALAGGDTVPAGTVVCGVGALPDVMLARKSGLEIGDLGGVACDSHLRTSAKGVFAAGDMCEFDSILHGRPMRIEHEEVAAAQGATVARNMLGAGAEHTEVPYFFSDLADWAWLEYVGPAADWDEEVVRGSVDDGAFTIFYLRENVVAAALTVGDRPGDLDRARELMRSREPVSPDAL